MTESEASQIIVFSFATGSLTAFLLFRYLGKDELNWKSGGYLEGISRRFHNSPREKQQEYVLRISQICAIGSAALVLSLGYPFLPTSFRVFMLPFLLVAAWFIGSKVGRRK